jgi:hypothetical protein
MENFKDEKLSTDKIPIDCNSLKHKYKFRCIQYSDLIMVILNILKFYSLCYAYLLSYSIIVPERILKIY